MELISVLLRLLLSDCKSVPGCSGHVQERGTEGFYEKNEPRVAIMATDKEAIASNGIEIKFIAA